MPVSKAFTDLLVDMLACLGPVSVRRMFGGAGLFHNGLMFALVADDTLYLKADGTNRAEFEAEGLGAFAYETSSGKRSIMSYWRAPERVLDDADEMQAWCRSAIDAAVRSEAGKSKARSKTRPGPKVAAEPLPKANGGSARRNPQTAKPAKSKAGRTRRPA